MAVVLAMICFPTQSYAGGGLGYMNVKGILELDNSYGNTVSLVSGPVATPFGYVNPILHPIA
ncbi:MAG: hypothetical protein EOP06_00315 [Proteobacteria bacterium]|nr:MAG: hypothetical protein EOP06_00315 [Pseudomonadota bacterium]